MLLNINVMIPALFASFGKDAISFEYCASRLLSALSSQLKHFKYKVLIKVVSLTALAFE